MMVISKDYDGRWPTVVHIIILQRLLLVITIGLVCGVSAKAFVVFGRTNTHKYIFTFLYIYLYCVHRNKINLY